MASKKNKVRFLTEAEKAERKIANRKDREDRFLRLVPKRVNKLANAARQLALCGGVGYVYTEEQRDEVLKAVKDAIQTVEDGFTHVTVGDIGFQFSAPAE